MSIQAHIAGRFIMQVGHMGTAWHAFCALPSAHKGGQITVPAAPTAICGRLTPDKLTSACLPAKAELQQKAVETFY